VRVLAAHMLLDHPDPRREYVGGALDHFCPRSAALGPRDREKTLAAAHPTLGLALSARHQSHYATKPFLLAASPSRDCGRLPVHAGYELVDFALPAMLDDAASSSIRGSEVRRC
jgi:hypothetical protein